MDRVAKLIYTGLISLDGYHADSQGNFDWAAPDQEVHAFVNDLERGIDTYLLGRRMYEVMSVWETLGTTDDEPVIQDYARIWQGQTKLSTRRRSAAHPRPAPGSSRRSIPAPSVTSRMPQRGSSASAGPPSLPTHSGPGWWMSAGSS